MQYTSRYNDMDEAVTDFSATARALNSYAQRLGKVSNSVGHLSSSQGFSGNINSCISSISTISDRITKVSVCLDKARDAYLIAEQRSQEAFSHIKIANAVNKDILGLFGSFNFPSSTETR